MSVSIPVRHEEVKSKPPIRSTYEFLNLILSVGDNCNTGFNVLIASDTCESLEDQMKKGKNVIELPDDAFQMMVQDMMRTNFARLGIGGINVSGYMGDIRKIVEELAMSRVEQKQEKKEENK